MKPHYDLQSVSKQRHDFDIEETVTGSAGWWVNSPGFTRLYSTALCIIEAGVVLYNALCMYARVCDVWCICVRMLSRPTLSMAAAIKVTL